MSKAKKAILALLVAIFAYCSTHERAKGSENIPVIDDSIKILQNCDLLKEKWPTAYAQLDGITPFVYYTTVKNENACAQFYAGIIVVYPPAFSIDCYGGNVTAVIAHEILHQIGLPNHKIRPRNEAEWVQYLRTDPIEKIMAVCWGSR